MVSVSYRKSRFPRAPFSDSPPCLARASGQRGGYTLLEICIVLAVMALLLSLAAPAFSTAYTESQLRGDARTISLLVKTAMLSSQEDHLSGNLIFDGKVVSWVEFDPNRAPARGSTDEDSEPGAPELTVRITPPNQLEIPDVDKPDQWIPLKKESWHFQAGELCPLDKLRLHRGEAWLELHFDSLTGNVASEAYNIP